MSHMVWLILNHLSTSSYWCDSLTQCQLSLFYLFHGCSVLPCPHLLYTLPSCFFWSTQYFLLLHQRNQKHPLSWGLSPFKQLYLYRRAGICFAKGCSETKGDKSSAKLCCAYYVPFIGQSLHDLWPCVHTVSHLIDWIALLWLHVDDGWEAPVWHL